MGLEGNIVVFISIQSPEIILAGMTELKVPSQFNMELFKEQSEGKRLENLFSLMIKVIFVCSPSPIEGSAGHF